MLKKTYQYAFDQFTLYCFMHDKMQYCLVFHILKICFILFFSETNKPLLLQQDTLPTILPLIHMDMHPVQFKLLGTIRMLVDGQGILFVCLFTILPLIHMDTF